MNAVPQSAFRSEGGAGKRRIAIGGLTGAVFLLTGMASADPAQREEARPPGLKLTSTAFRDAGPLPSAYTGYAEGGNGISPPLEWNFASYPMNFSGPGRAPVSSRAGGLARATPPFKISNN